MISNMILIAEIFQVQMFIKSVWADLRSPLYGSAIPWKGETANQKGAANVCQVGVGRACEVPFMGKPLTKKVQRMLVKSGWAELAKSPLWGRSPLYGETADQKGAAEVCQVGVGGLEPPTPASQTRCAANCATPRTQVVSIMRACAAVKQAFKFVTFSHRGWFYGSFWLAAA